MKTLLEYILREEECDATPANTIGMGNPNVTDLISAPADGLPEEDMRITKRRKRRRIGKRDYPMTGKVHNV